MKTLSLKVVNVVAVRFHEIGFVHAGLLIVGAREVLALGSGRRRARFSRGPGADGPVFHRHLGAVHPNATPILVLISDGLQQLNAIFLLDGGLEGILKGCTVIKPVQVRVGDGSGSDG